MATNKQIRERIRELKKEFDALKKDKKKLLTLIDEAEVPEAVYNSNAIENSTLSLSDTEKILLDAESRVDALPREIYEAKNLALVSAYISEHAGSQDVGKELILHLHKLLLTGIDNSIAGRFRGPGEYVRVGTHVAPAPEHVESMIDSLLVNYASDHETYGPDMVAQFHLEFEHIHPFLDGNGRIGRVLMNWQLARLGFPPIIVRDKEKKLYYAGFPAHRDKKNSKLMQKVLTLALSESLHKRITHLRGTNIVRLSDYAKQSGKSASALTNAARRQNIPAFREKGIWKIPSDA